MKIFIKYIQTEREYGLKAAGFDDHLLDTAAVITQKIDQFMGGVSIHISGELQMQTITVSMMSDFKI
jgi:hypothetical protein